ncbi:hypothetical protein ABZ023_34755 [Streptomyces sp. NPDC006367]|uniref:hypothetical protein n=1 Tax=unclassified Streptomyces TaxID=2593676 RepID=UPI0033AB2DB1
MNGFHLAAAAGCTAPSLGSLALGFLPWLLLVFLGGAIAGAAVGWISRRAGDSRWEALRHGVMASVAWVGPPLAILLSLVSLFSQCR